MRTTSWSRNVTVEEQGKPFVIAEIKKQFSSFCSTTLDEVLYKEETRPAAQKKGIDWWVLPIEGRRPYLVDAKVRKGSWKYWSCEKDQDIMIEWSQSGGKGWANNETYLTDWVLWVFPDAPKGYSTSIMVPHPLLQLLFPQDERIIRRFTHEHGGVIREGWNGSTLSHTICCTRAQLQSGANAIGWKGPVWLTPEEGEE